MARMPELIGLIDKAIEDNWQRIESNYSQLYEERSRNKDIKPSEISDSILNSLVKKALKEIENDGSDFIYTPDGIGSRLNEWIYELLGANYREIYKARLKK